MAEDLYQALLLAHHKSPTGYELKGDFTHFAEGENGACGDEVFVNAKLSDSCFEALGFAGESCAICRASASIMCQLIPGKTRQQVQDIIQISLNYLNVDNSNNALFEDSVDSEMKALSSVHAYPIRLQCARLPWTTLAKLMDNWH
ncbi:iron-sulfur cluster assembly scaffold protein [Thalassotalea fusca]